MDGLYLKALNPKLSVNLLHHFKTEAVCPISIPIGVFWSHLFCKKGGRVSLAFYSISNSCASSMTATPRDWAFVSLLPAASPATT